MGALTSSSFCGSEHKPNRRLLSYESNEIK